MDGHRKGPVIIYGRSGTERNVFLAKNFADTTIKKSENFYPTSNINKK
jgi:hypothetical protein